MKTLACRSGCEGPGSCPNAPDCRSGCSEGSASRRRRWLSFGLILCCCISKLKNATCQHYFPCKRAAVSGQRGVAVTKKCENVKCMGGGWLTGQRSRAAGVGKDMHAGHACNRVVRRLGPMVGRQACSMKARAVS